MRLEADKQNVQASNLKRSAPLTSNPEPLSPEPLTALTLYYRHRPQPGHFFSDTGVMDDIYYPVDVFVGCRCFFRQAGHATGAHMNALCFKLLAQTRSVY